MEFEEWFKQYLGCDWEDFEENLSENDMKRAFDAGKKLKESARWNL